MNPTTIALVALGALLLLATGSSLNASMPRRHLLPLALADVTSAELGVDQPGLTARLRQRAIVAGLALGLAMSIGRLAEQYEFEAAFRRTTWVATMLPPDSVMTTRALRVHQRGRPR